jgi:hypothetical protein
MREITCGGRLRGGGAVPGAVPVGSGGRRRFPSSDSRDAAAAFLGRHLYTARPPPPTQRRSDGRTRGGVSGGCFSGPPLLLVLLRAAVAGSTRARWVNMLGLARRVPAGLAFASGQGEGGAPPRRGKQSKAAPDAGLVLRWASLSVCPRRLLRCNFFISEVPPGAARGLHYRQPSRLNPPPSARSHRAHI